MVIAQYNPWILPRNRWKGLVLAEVSENPAKHALQQFAFESIIGSGSLAFDFRLQPNIAGSG